MRMFFIAALTFAAVACASVFDYPVKQENKKDLVAFVSQMTSDAIIHGNFKQTKSIQKLKRDFVSTGKFAIVNGKGILWATEKPFVSRLWVFDNGITQTDARGNEKKLSASENPVFAEFSKIIQAVFSGNVKELEKKFEVFFENANGSVQVGLVPREKAVRSVIASITMEGKNSFEKITILDGDKNPIVYEFTDQKFEKTLDPKIMEIYKLPKP